ncbi:CG17005 [Drosophila busckii]|uniref:CG17005 n=1 Tax=Drosophila busckii TaxID=30019 RepID=A0A0M4EA65_DROBS|nr:CG17005 [Drosophila busckii]ALC39385.1 CG17005 [Drosophila busckii]
MTCTGVLKPLPPTYQKLMVENLTVIRPPILKIYYWESFDIAGLNKKLRSNQQYHDHVLVIPVRQIQSQPLKMIFWLRNMSAKPLTLNLKRIQNCACRPLQTRVGFNQFRQLYHCPHRRLIHLSQETLNLKPDEVLPLSVTAHFFLYGMHMLIYEVHTEDKRMFTWKFQLEISAFDPDKCLLTKELLPVNIKHFQHVTQPIWVQNITMTHLAFNFSTRERSFKLHNSNLTVPRQSVWPLLVEYRPLDYENELELVLTFDKSKARYKIKARGIITDEDELTDMPLKDRQSADYLYVIYPNRLSFDICLRERRTQLGHHSKLCEIKLTVYDRLIFFRRIPIVLEVHRILDEATLIAQAELSEIESIDDPKWKEDSYIEHVFLHLNVRASTRDIVDTELDNMDQDVGLCSPCGGAGLDVGAAGDATPTSQPSPEQKKQTEREQTVRRLAAKNKLNANEIIELSMAIDQRTTIFEKLFWKYLSKSSFMRIGATRSRSNANKTYQEVVVGELVSHSTSNHNTVDRNTVMEVISRLMVDATNDLAKNWIFIPSQYYDRQT